MRRSEREALRTASRQVGVLARRQALQAGMTERQIRERCRSGRWRRLEPGVYLVAGAPDGWRVRATVACLACGPGAVMSRRAAAFLWGLIERPPRVLEIAVPHGRRVEARRGRKVHRATALGKGDIGEVERLSVTSPCRTLVDLAGVLGPRELEAVLDAALGRKLVTVPSL